jgi:hypothetical protein
VSTLFSGIVTTSQCSQLNLTADVSTTFTSGIFSEADNCTVVFNVEGVNNVIVTPMFVCVENALIVVNIYGDSNALTDLVINGAGNSVT